MKEFNENRGESKSEIPPLTDEFKQLVKAPTVSWPAIFLFFASLGVVFYIYYLVVFNQFPIWLGVLINGIAIYFMFTPVHDAAHGAISRHKIVNEVVGHIGMFFFGPLAPFNLARWIHMQHHRFTNEDDKDPDSFAHKFDLFTAVRWLNFDYYYSLFFFKQAGPVVAKFKLHLIIHLSLVVVLVAASVYLEFFLELFMLWLLPTRISSVLFVIMFVYLPHSPFSVTSKEDEYKASSLRVGWEWLLTPFMVFQNFHLVHHLYPTAPFYQLKNIWNARLDYHLSRNPLKVGAFTLSATEQDYSNGETKGGGK